jgi:DNA mismatch endonuclease (patch repair protein)
MDEWPEVSPERSALMARVRSKNTSPEMEVRRALHRAGLRFRLHKKGLPGRPDVVLPSRKAAVFVHGCFWHRHPGCARTRTPKTRREWWQAKFASNVARDKKAHSALGKLGWKVFVIWECQTEVDAKIVKLVKTLHELEKRRTTES